MSIQSEIDRLKNVKTAIKDAIVAKGVEVPEGTTFRQYAEKISEISSSSQNYTYSEEEWYLEWYDQSISKEINLSSGESLIAVILSSEDPIFISQKAYIATINQGRLKIELNAPGAEASLTVYLNSTQVRLNLYDPMGIFYGNYINIIILKASS